MTIRKSKLICTSTYDRVHPFRFGSHIYWTPTPRCLCNTVAGKCLWRAFQRSPLCRTFLLASFSRKSHTHTQHTWMHCIPTLLRYVLHLSSAKKLFFRFRLLAVTCSDPYSPANTVVDSSLGWQFFSPTWVVTIQSLKRGYCRSWCLVAGGNLLEAGWGVNIINFVRPNWCLGFLCHRRCQKTRPLSVFRRWETK